MSKYIRVVECDENSVLIEKERGFISGLLFKKPLLVKFDIINKSDWIYILKNSFGRVIVNEELNNLILKYNEVNGLIELKPITQKLNIPKDWFVYECGQDPLHMLWFMTLVNFKEFSNGHKHPAQVFVEEQDSFDVALQNAIKELNSKVYK